MYFIPSSSIFLSSPLRSAVVAYSNFDEFNWFFYLPTYILFFFLGKQVFKYLLNFNDLPLTKSINYLKSIIAIQGNTTPTRNYGKYQSYLGNSQRHSSIYLIAAHSQVDKNLCVCRLPVSSAPRLGPNASNTRYLNLLFPVPRPINTSFSS